jgi:hypothetical protein
MASERDDVSFTPGPWEAHCFMVKAGRDTITQTGYSSSLAGNPSRSFEAEANARLIAAAPELLACLTEFYFGHDRVEGPARDKMFADAKAAIAKATQPAARTSNGG